MSTTKKKTGERTDLGPIPPPCPNCKKADMVYRYAPQVSYRKWFQHAPEDSPHAAWFCERCFGWLTAFGFTE